MILVLFHWVTLVLNFLKFLRKWSKVFFKVLRNILRLVLAWTRCLRFRVWIVLASDWLTGPLLSGLALQRAAAPGSVRSGGRTGRLRSDPPLLSELSSETSQNKYTLSVDRNSIRGSRFLGPLLKIQRDINIVWQYCLIKMPLWNQIFGNKWGFGVQDRLLYLCMYHWIS